MLDEAEREEVQELGGDAEPHELDGFDVQHARRWRIRHKEVGRD